MNITSPNKTEHITNWTFRFVNGEVVTYTLVDGLDLIDTSNLHSYTITMKDPENPVQTIRRIRIFLNQLTEVETVPSERLIYAKGESPMEKAAAAAAARAVPFNRRHTSSAST